MVKVITQIEKGTLDVAIVIPSCNEGHNILGKIYSLAVQNGVRRARVGIFIVVNNAPDALLRVKESNLHTLDVMSAIQNQSTQVINDPNERILKRGLPAYEELTIEDLIRESFQISSKLVLIDASTPGNAIHDSNVGRARRKGFEVASEYMDPQGLGLYITHDADNICIGETLSKVVDYARENPGIDAFRGGWRISRFNNVSNELWHVVDTAYTSLVYFTETAYCFITSGERKAYDLPGSFTVIKKSVYDEIGGYSPLPTAEDGDLSVRLHSGGYKTGAVDAEIEVNMREFTQCSRGLGGSIGKWYDQAQAGGIGSVPVIASGVYPQYRTFFDEVNFIRNNYTEGIEEKVFRSFERHFSDVEGYRELSGEEQQSLISELMKTPPEIRSQINPFFDRKLKSILADIFGEGTLDEAWGAVERHVKDTLRMDSTPVLDVLGELQEYERRLRRLGELDKTGIIADALNEDEAQVYNEEARFLAQREMTRYAILMPSFEAFIDHHPTQSNEICTIESMVFLNKVHSIYKKHILKFRIRNYFYYLIDVITTFVNLADIIPEEIAEELVELLDAFTSFMDEYRYVYKFVDSYDYNELKWQVLQGRSSMVTRAAIVFRDIDRIAQVYRLDSKHVKNLKSKLNRKREEWGFIANILKWI